MSRMFASYGMNSRGRDFVVGDIHGCFVRLADALERLQFDPESDRLFSVGDLVDRGPQSEDVLEWLGYDWFHSVRGNHCQMVIDHATDPDQYASYHFSNGGGWFYGLPDVEKQCYAIALDELPLAMEVMTREGMVGIVHAEPVGTDWTKFKQTLQNIHMLSEQDANEFIQACMWSRTRIRYGYDNKITGVKTVYVGHTVCESDTTLGNVHYIDTGAVFGYDFTIVQIH